MDKKTPKTLPALSRERSLEFEVVKRADDAPEGEGFAEYELALSSEIEVERWFGNEILSHKSEAVDLSRMDGAPLLLDHSTREQVGVFTSCRLDKDRVLRGTVRFSRSVRGQEIEQDVKDAIRTKISVGYRVLEMELTRTSKDGPDVYTVTRWMPVEGSLVAIPADPTVGMGRSHEEKQFPVLCRELNRSDTTTTGAGNMSNENGNTPAPVVRSAEEIGRDIGEVYRMAQAHGLPEKAEDWVARGLSPDQVAREILASRRTDPSAAPAAPILTPKEAREYSLVRALAAAVALADGVRVENSFELEVGEDVRRSMPVSYKGRGGVYVPHMAMGSRAPISAALDSGTPLKGGNTVFTQYAGFIELLRNLSFAVRMGARVLPGLSSPISFTKQTGAGTASWVGENTGTDVTGSNLATGLVTLSPKTLQSSTAISRQLLVQSSDPVEQMVRNDLMSIHALAWDRAVAHGAGSTEPTGLYGLSGVNAVAFGGAPTFDKIVDMISAIAADNALLGSLGFVTTPELAAKMMKTLEFAVNGSSKLWTGKLYEGDVAGYQALATNQISKVLGVGTNEHGILFGNWSDALIGQFGGGVEIIVDPYTLKKQGMIELTSFQMCDIAFRHPESFSKGTGATV